jgi:hypothetical protein
LALAPSAVVTLALELYHPPTETTDSAAVSFAAAAALTILPLTTWSQSEE